jgi:histone-lysine N-methyltransferase SETD3
MDPTPTPQQIFDANYKALTEQDPDYDYDLNIYYQCQDLLSKGSDANQTQSLFNKSLQDTASLILAFDSIRATVIPPNMMEDYLTNKRLMKWLESKGASFKGIRIFYESNGYRGIKINETTLNGERILVVPRECIITHEDARDCSVIGKILSGKKIEFFASNHTYLAIFLLQEWERGENSKWKLYLDSLPRDFSNHPINFFDTELSLLAGCSNIANQITSLQQQMRSDYDKCCQNCENFQTRFTFEKFSHFRCSVSSRMFGFEIGPLKTGGLVPFADMLNHRRPKLIFWDYDNVSALKNFNFEVLEDLEPGAEIFDSYGKKCNSRF